MSVPNLMSRIFWREWYLFKPHVLAGKGNSMTKKFGPPVIYLWYICLCLEPKFSQQIQGGSDVNTCIVNWSILMTNNKIAIKVHSATNKSDQNRFLRIVETNSCKCKNKSMPFFSHNNSCYSFHMLPKVFGNVYWFILVLFIEKLYILVSLIKPFLYWISLCNKKKRLW